MKYFSVIFVTLYILYFSFSRFWIQDLKISFLDVGQGDSILVQLSGGYQLLVDGGEGDDVIIELGKLLPPWDRTLELVVLTHPHLDHVGGLLEVLERFDIKEVWLNPIGYKIPEFLVFIEELYSDINNVLITFPHKDFTKNVNGLLIKVVWPKEKAEYEDFISFTRYMLGYDEKTSQKSSFSGSDVNNSSIVLLLSYGNFDILLTGDAEIDAEGQFTTGLLKNRPIDVLKAGHHCSRTASSEKLLKVITPKLAICSYGEGNKFGHPHSETLGRFEEFGIDVLSTAQEGTITIKSDGDVWWVI